jgi:hypothetical protein
MAPTVRGIRLQGAWVRRQLVAHLMLLVGLFCAFSQVSGALHWVLVEHARCAEHDAWVHADESDHSHSDAPAAPTSVSAQAAGADEHGHDHCDSLRTPRELTLVASARSSLSAPLVLGSSGEMRRSDSKAPAASYELAPKTSPPAWAS